MLASAKLLAIDNSIRCRVGWGNLNEEKISTFADNYLDNYRIFGKSSTSIIDYLLEQSGTSINHEEIASKLLRSLKSKEDAVIESIEGYQMTDAQKYRMRLVRVHMDYITAEINDVDKMIENMISSFVLNIH